MWFERKRIVVTLSIMRDIQVEGFVNFVNYVGTGSFDLPKFTKLLSKNIVFVDGSHSSFEGPHNIQPKNDS